jgi:hypothetical protein
MVHLYPDDFLDLSNGAAKNSKLQLQTVRSAIHPAAKAIDAIALTASQIEQTTTIRPVVASIAKKLQTQKSRAKQGDS